MAQTDEPGLTHEYFSLKTDRDTIQDLKKAAYEEHLRKNKETQDQDNGNQPDHK